MIDLMNDDDDTTPALELAAARPVLPAYQRGELPRRLRGEWPESVDAPATAAPSVARMSDTEARQYWRRRRAE